jgi:hypothetical protein
MMFFYSKLSVFLFTTALPQIEVESPQRQMLVFLGLQERP